MPIASTSPTLSPQTQGECDETPDGKLVLSNGWLARWKGRHGVFSVHLHRELISKALAGPELSCLKSLVDINQKTCLMLTKLGILSTSR